jgi:hypothetical protein
VNQDFIPARILESSDVPNGTYFRTGDAEPVVNEADRTITVFDGRGSHRGWGSPSVTSTVVLETLDVVAIHVGFRHKHGGSQFWRYYYVNGGITQVRWSQINDDMRAAILEAAGKRAPRWANSPGGLRSQYKSSNPKAKAFTAYKVVGVNGDGELTSLYDPDIVYTLGRTKVQAARGGVDYDGSTRHNGGWYVHLDREACVQKYLDGNLVAESKMQPLAALIRCECWGNTVQYNNGKIAVTYCKPLEIIEYINL